MPSDQQQQPKLAASRKRRASSEGPEPAEAADLDCAICGDKATGRHYGAMSCDGCKGFFRRTIRKRHAYVCRYVKACNVDKAHRNTCRSCRYARCISSGMKPAAVQRERDRISTIVHHDTTPPPPPQTPTTSATTPSMPSQGPAIDSETIIGKLMQAESRMRQLRSSVITRTADAYRMATTVDVTESIHQQLILMVEWAKQLEQFRRLPMQAQINLLRHFSAQHLVICAAFRSLGATNDTICLTNDSSLHRDAPTIPDVNRVAARILDHLTTPMKRLAMDEKEYVALKAVAFFDPIARGVEEWSADIERTRDEVLFAFEHYATKLSPQKGMSFRLASLLLLLPPIMSIARDLAEEAQLAKIFGMADIDTLMAELMLPEDPDNNTYQHLKQVTASTALSFNPGQEIHPAPETTVPVSGGTATTLFGLTSLPIQTSAPTTGAALPMPLHLPMGPSFTSSQFFM